MMKLFRMITKKFERVNKHFVDKDKKFEELDRLLVRRGHRLDDMVKEILISTTTVLANPSIGAISPRPCRAVGDFERLVSLLRDSFVSGSSGGVDESSRRGKGIFIQVSKIRSLCLYHEA